MQEYTKLNVQPASRSGSPSLIFTGAGPQQTGPWTVNMPQAARAGMHPAPALNSSTITRRVVSEGGPVL